LRKTQFNQEKKKELPLTVYQKHSIVQKKEKQQYSMRSLSNEPENPEENSKKRKPTELLFQ